MGNSFRQGYALLIGVGGDLPCTVRDVHGVRNILCDPERCAYPPDHVRVLTGKGATVGHICSELQRLARVIREDQKDSTVIVYFSGHGYMTMGSGSPVSQFYLMPAGYDLRQLEQTALSGAAFTELLETIRAERFLLVLDCCFAGGFEVPKSAGFEQGKAWPAEIDAIFNNKHGRALVASSKATQVSRAGDPYSAFTHSLIEGLGGNGVARADGLVHVTDLALYVHKSVMAKTRDQQTPVFDISQSDNFPIAYYSAGSKEIKNLSLPEFKLEPFVGDPEPTESLSTDYKVDIEGLKAESEAELIGVDQNNQPPSGGNYKSDVHLIKPRVKGKLSIIGVRQKNTRPANSNKGDK